MEEKRSHPGTAAVLSFVFNGLGQIYNGQIRKGMFIIFLSTLSLLILIIGAILIAFWLFGRALFPAQIILGSLFFSFGLILICILGVWGIFDAYKNAQG